MGGVMDEFMVEALAEAQAGFEEGGWPIGSVLVKNGEILGRGRNLWFQNGDPTSHAEMEAFRDAARRAMDTRDRDELEEYLRGGTVYTTMMPCEMCTGAIIRLSAEKVVVGETTTYIDAGTRLIMERQGIEVSVLQSPECIALVELYFRRHPERRAAMDVPSKPAVQL